MFCPRCGRPLSPTANFCGGCGMPKSEIEKVRPVQPQPAAVKETDINELNSTISRLEADLTGVNPIENYTIDAAVNTNTDTEQSENFTDRIRIAIENQYEPQTESEDTEEIGSAEETAYSTQSEYSRNAPQHPMYTQSTYTPSRQPVLQEETVSQVDQTLTTVDFVWMLLISSIPVVGLFYIIYQAFVQQENMNRRAWARATMIVAIFGFAMAAVFSVGFVMTNLLYW